MMKINFLTQPEVDEFCKYVCYQLQKSGSKKSDVEALYFAVYWQISFLLEQKVRIIAEPGCEVSKFRQRIQTLTASLADEACDVLQIIDRNIVEFVDRRYLKIDS